MSSKIIKHPRTPHTSTSDWKDDNIVLTSYKDFEGKHIVITEKMDGENITMYRDAMHGKQLNDGIHPSQAWVRAYWKLMRSSILEGLRVCGENLYTRRIIKYEKLPSFFLGYAVWDKELCLDWETTLFLLWGMEIKNVPILYHGMFDIEIIKKFESWVDYSPGVEGIVFRNTDSFHYDEFNKNIAQYTTVNHSREKEAWMNRPLEYNRMGK